MRPAAERLWKLSAAGLNIKSAGGYYASPAVQYFYEPIV